MTAPNFVPAESPAPAHPLYVRPREGAVIAGVAAGLSHHLRVEVTWVRLVLLALVLTGGIGLLCYAGVWMVSTRSADPEVRAVDTRPVPKPVWWLLLFLTLFFGGFSAPAESTGWHVAGPLVVIGLGAAVAWFAFDRGVRSVGGVLAVAAGAVLVLGGVVFALVLGSGEESGAGFAAALTAVVLTLLGVALIAVPAGLRVWEKVSAERAEKVAADERATIAAHLHDSVLQTLALIQKQAGDREAVVRLARSQERELRQWLFDTQEKQTLSVFGAIERACGEVEDLFGLRLAPVTVGEDRPLSDAAQAAVLAAREACVNAAKHAGVEDADVYAELLGGRLEIFVRDRGAGFDPDEVPADRHGLADSVTGRMARVGGTAEVRSAPGEGTEVRVAVELD